MEMIEERIAEPLGGDDLVMRLMYELHTHVPEEQRPMSMSDLSDEQAARARKAVHAVLTEWESVKAVLAAVRTPEPRPANGEMIEKVARAISAKRHELIDLPPPHWKGGEIWNKVDVVLTPAERDRYRHEAIAAITAYNPNERLSAVTPMMIAAAREVADGVDDIAFERIFIAMMDAAPASHGVERLREALEEARRALEPALEPRRSEVEQRCCVNRAMTFLDAALARTSPSGLRE